MIILCEDLQQRTFLTRTLAKLGFEPKRFRRIALPAGKGSGEQYVREQFPVEVKAFRSRAARMQLGLVVMMDADAQSVQSHYLQLDAMLQSSLLPIRAANERIAILIPKWNIETWIHFLFGDVERT